jgi:hypothetical protein
LIAAARLLAVAIAAAALAGCSLAAAPLSVSNGTTMAVELFVNGSRIETIQPGAQVDVAAARLPPLPWTAEIRHPAGRVLDSLVVRAGDVVGGNGDGSRVDLSCGRIDLWSGPPLLGPVPGPGTPGDCDP